MQLMLHILVTFVRYLKCGKKYDLLNLAHWPSSNGHFFCMEDSLFNIAYYVYPRSISIGIITVAAQFYPRTHGECKVPGVLMGKGECSP